MNGGSRRQSAGRRHLSNSKAPFIALGVMAALNGHLVFSSSPMWSHIRGLCVLTSKVVAETATTVTLLVPNWATTFEKCTAEVARCLESAGSVKGVVRIIAVGPRSANPMDACEVYADTFEPVWKSLVEESPVKCAVTGVEHPGVTKPTMVMLDGFEYVWLPIIRATLPVPVLVWMIGFSGGLLRGFLPHARGGMGDELRAPFTPEEWEKGKPYQCTGEVIKIDSMPIMYDWESWPQALPHTGTLQRIEANYARFMYECDGLATSCAVGYDTEEALAVVTSWIGERQKPTFHMGPMIPLEPGSTEFARSSLEAEMAAAPAGVGAKITQFLEQAEHKHGEKSVVYICFGTFFWPSNPGHLWLLIETLAHRGIPFILSCASPYAQVPDELSKRFADSDDGCIVPWSPQQSILAHKAVGWFVSHCGGGGSMETLTQGVPTIAWPFHADQPINSAHLVHTLDVGFEFYEVRTGPYGRKPIYATKHTPIGTLDAFKTELDGILDAMKGEVGARKRSHALERQSILRKAWTAGGPARTAFESFLSTYVNI